MVQKKANFSVCPRYKQNNMLYESYLQITADGSYIIFNDNDQQVCLWYDIKFGIFSYQLCILNV